MSRSGAVVVLDIDEALCFRLTRKRTRAFAFLFWWYWYRSDLKKNRPREKPKTNHDRVEMPSWPKQVFGESVWLRLLSGAGEEGLIRASVPHLCTHRLSKNVCHHHVRRGCPPRRCPRQRRPPVRATRKRRARRRGSIPPARLASGPGSQRARLFSRRRERGARGPIGTGSARTSRRAHERREALHVPAIADAGARLEARAIETRRSPVECRARFHPSRSAIRFERLRNTGHSRGPRPIEPAFG